MDLTAAEQRVLGCLLEKQRTTPDVYPLTLNALRAACNQTTNRDPVLGLDENTVRDALARLGRRRWTRLASGARAPKYRHLLDEALPLAPAEYAVLAVMLLRGPQMPGELNARAERLHPLGGLPGVHETLRGLAERGLVARRERRPGQKEERYGHLLGEEEDDDAGRVRAPVAAGTPADAGSPEAARAEAPPATPSAPPADARLERLEEEVAALRAEVTALREALCRGGWR